MAENMEEHDDLINNRYYSKIAKLQKYMIFKHSIGLILSKMNS